MRLLVPIDNVVFDVEYEYEPAYDGGTGPNSEQSWTERVILYGVNLAVPGAVSDLLPFLNDASIKDIEKEILRRLK